MEYLLPEQSPLCRLCGTEKIGDNPDFIRLQPNLVIIFAGFLAYCSVG